VHNDLLKYASSVVVDDLCGRGIHLDDSSRIPLIERLPMAAGFQLRARLRAASGDVVLSNCEPPRAYESYNSDRLGLGSTMWLQPGYNKESMAVTDDCLASAECLETLARLLAVSGGGYIHPYVSFEEIWLLAQELSNRSNSTVSVVGPIPAVAGLVNNKCRFLEFARVIAGGAATVPFAVGSSPSVVANLLQQLSRSTNRLLVRLPDSTAGLGTAIVDTSSLPAANHLTSYVEAMLAALGWDGRADVLLSPWISSLMSVSTQMWIPPLRLGLPVCEGIYEQYLHPRNGMQFWGAKPVQLPDNINAELLRLSRVICAALQRAGYIGRCSYDFLLVGEHLASSRPIFVECNGRWGGTSSVMSLVDRISPASGRLAHSFGPIADDALRGVSFDDILKTFRSELFESRTGSRRGVMLYNVGGLAAGRVDICAVDADQKSAVQLWEECARKLRGMDSDDA